MVLAPYVGAFADCLPKGTVMFLSNAIKIAGCALMLFDVNPLLAYALVGLRRRGLFASEIRHPHRILPHSKLVVANGWIEGLTVASIILGVMLGGMLISSGVSSVLLGFDMPLIDTGIDTPPEAAIAVIIVVYAIAALFNLYIPNTGVDQPLPARTHWFLIRDFAHCGDRLWRDKLGPDFAGDDDAVLGRRRDTAIHRHRLGRAALGYNLSRRVHPAGRCRDRHRAWRRVARRCACVSTGRSRCCRSASPWG